MEAPKIDLKGNKKILLLLLALVVAIILGTFLMNNGQFSSNNLLPTTDTYTKPEDVLEEGIDYKIVLKTTAGDIKIDLFEDETPITVNNIIFLIGKGYYEDVTFHRVVKGFVIQTGDPTGTGSGNPGYSIKDEITDREYEAYSVGMANSGPNTNGSQFFITSGSITQGNIDALNGGYTLFGRVIEGFAVVDSIERVAVDGNDKPVNDVVIESIQILED
ncbi:MAG: peptidylprolyl isomerase [Candidatus Dojkabacteria bacterium]|nr:peptidylprolyl isomerase [Candidatus Dojkabacteria bacterium]